MRVRVLFLLFIVVYTLSPLYIVGAGSGARVNVSGTGWALLVLYDMEDPDDDAPVNAPGTGWGWDTSVYHSPVTSLRMNDIIGLWWSTGDYPSGSNLRVEAWVYKGAYVGAYYVYVGLCALDEQESDYGYYAEINFGDDMLYIRYYDSGGFTTLAQVNYDFQAGVWYKLVLQIDYAGNTLYAYVYSSSGSLLVSTSANDDVSSFSPVYIIVAGGGSQYVDDVALYFSSSDYGNYRTPITIVNNMDTDLHDVQVRIRLTGSNWDGWDKVLPDGGDIYFTSDKDEPLYYWVESIDTQNMEAVIWVKIPLLPASSSVTIYMYYGGGNPYSSFNDPEKVFILYDDFNTLDTGKWIIPDDMSVSVDSSYLVISDSGYHWNEFYGIQYNGNIPLCPIVIEAGGYVFIQPSNSLGRFYIDVYANKNDGTRDALNLVGVADGWAAYTGFRYFVAGDTSWKGSGGSSGETPETVVYDHVYMVADLVSNSFETDVLYQGSWINITGSEDITLENVSSIGLILFYNRYSTSYGADIAKLDWIRVYRYADYSVSIGGSEYLGGRPWFKAVVYPTSVSVMPGDGIGFNVNVSNIGNVTGWVVVELVDHNNNVRDSVNLTIDPGDYDVIVLSTVATDSDHGNWTWFVIGSNDTTVFFNISVNVLVYLAVSVEYSYTFIMSPSVSTSVVSPINNSYYMGIDASMQSSIVSPVDNSYSLGFNVSMSSIALEASRSRSLYGSRACLYVYVDNESVFSACSATLYTLTIRYVLRGVSAPPDYPDAYVVIYQRLGNVLDEYARLYIPEGDVSIILEAGTYYSIAIPESGSTVYGYRFVLDHYDVDGLGETDTIYLDRDHVLTIYYNIYSGDDGNGGGGGGYTFITVTPPELDANASELLPPNLAIGSPGIYTVKGILLVALFIGLFIVFLRNYPVGQALVLTSALLMLTSILLFGLALTPVFMVLLLVGLVLWKVLGK